MAAPIRWRVLDPDLSWRSWNGEDECVVYSPRSASVHLLNAAAARLVQLVANRPRSITELAEELARERGAAADEAFVAAVTESVGGLDAAGLLTPDRA